MSLQIPLSLSDPKYEEIARRVRESYPQSCILWVDKINNPELEQKQEELIHSIRSKHDIPIMRLELFHGTKESSAIAICRGGFKSEYNVRSAYGIGTYFAKNANYSIQYSKQKTGNHDDIVYMLLCSVVFGKDKNVYTNISVDKIGDPNIYVSPHDSGGIPKYLIAFHKNPTI